MSLVRRTGSRRTGPRHTASVAIVTVLAILVAAFGAFSAAGAQSREFARDTTRVRVWPRLVAGAAASLALHEAGHIGAAYALGGHVTFGFDKLRPTVYSGIDDVRDPHKQFLFSAAGLAVQTLLDEAVLDVPHARGSVLERGILAGGIGTTLFYVTVGRRGSVSDMEYMARMHGMTETQSTLLFGGIAAVQVLRMAHDPAYAHFFAAPTRGGAAVGVSISE